MFSFKMVDKIVLQTKNEQKVVTLEYAHDLVN